MIYRNDDTAALDAGERERLGNYGSYADEGCLICGLTNPVSVYVDCHVEAVGCSGCITEADYDGICPNCKSSKYEHVYINEDNEVIGCSSCIREVYCDEYQ